MIWMLLSRQGDAVDRFLESQLRQFELQMVRSLTRPETTGAPRKSVAT